MKGDPGRERARFATQVGAVLTMIGVAVGLGNVWRFPYMVGAFGGGAFLAVYLFFVALVGVPALMTEWALGRATRRGTVGAFEEAGLRGGRALGWFFFAVVAAATAYYTNVVGWVLVYAVGEIARLFGADLAVERVLPPETGVDLVSVGLQVGATTVAILGCCWVLVRGLRRGTERVSRIVMPMLLAILLILIARSVTLEGAGAGVRWMFTFDVGAVTAPVVMAALGQAIFSLSLGGTFMVVYGSYLDSDAPLGRAALWTALGDSSAGLLAGLAIFPAVFALGLEPGSGPGLLFQTLPEVFGRIPGGGLFGLLFFLGLAAAAFLSDIAAFEVLVAGLTDNTRMARRQAIVVCAGVVFLLALPPMLNLAVFVPWDLTFGSGMQTLGALAAVLTVGWTLSRRRALDALGLSEGPWTRLFLFWIRWAVPTAVLAVGGWWLWTAVLERAPAL